MFEDDVDPVKEETLPAGDGFTYKSRLSKPLQLFAQNLVKEQLKGSKAHNIKGKQFHTPYLLSSLGLLAEDERKDHFADLKAFQTNEGLGLVVDEMVMQRAFRSGILKDIVNEHKTTDP